MRFDCSGNIRIEKTNKEDNSHSIVEFPGSPISIEFTSNPGPDKEGEQNLAVKFTSSSVFDAEGPTKISDLSLGRVLSATVETFPVERKAEARIGEILELANYDGYLRSLSFRDGDAHVETSGYTDAARLGLPGRVSVDLRPTLLEKLGNELHVSTVYSMLGTLGGLIIAAWTWLRARD